MKVNCVACDREMKLVAGCVCGEKLMYACEGCNNVIEIEEKK